MNIHTVELTLLAAFATMLWPGPRAVESLARILQKDRISETPRAWLEARFGERSLAVYLSRCFRCMAHWVAFLWCFAAGIPMILIGLPWQVIPIMLFLIPTTVSLAEEKHEKN